jgi:uncharacterized membrane protein
MSKHEAATARCEVCGRTLPRSSLVPGAIVRPSVVQLIREQHPEWRPEGMICYEDLNRFRNAYVHSLLESERGELTSLELEVVRSLQEHELVARDIEADVERDRTVGERFADRIASFGGSWFFLILFGVFLALWVLSNSVVVLWRPLDPYPFIFLNLLLSCLAAIQAPVIMMSQNRQEAKDRLRAKNDFEVNLKAELEIRHLHEKVDHLLQHQWERLAAIQEIQLELLSELGRR